MYDGRGGRHRLPLLSRLVLLSAVAATACAPPWFDDDADETNGLPRALGERPEFVTEEDPQVAAPSGSSVTTAGTPATTAVGQPGMAGTAPPVSTTPSRSGERRALLDLTDPAGDVDRLAARFADLRRLLVEDLGSGETSIRVDVAAAVPPRLAEGEVVGIGVDFSKDLTTAEPESQVFIDGGTAGWTAYFWRNGRFVEFPGRFRIEGSALTVVVPWSAFGDDRPHAASVFVDWSKRTLVLGASSEDRAPQRGMARFS